MYTFVYKINIGKVSKELKRKINYIYEIHGYGARYAKIIRLPATKKSSSQKSLMWRFTYIKEISAVENIFNIFF